MHVRKAVTGLILFLLTITLAGQEKKSQAPPISQRLFYGGSFGLQFGTITNIELSPVVGLWVLPRVAVAAGPSYQYYKDPYGSTSIYGGKGFVQLTLIQDFNNIIPIGFHAGFFVQGEYDGLSLEKALFSNFTEPDGRVYSGCFLAGPGISQPMGVRAFMNITFLWQVIEPKYSVFDSPQIRFSFYF